MTILFDLFALKLGQMPWKHNISLDQTFLGHNKQKDIIGMLNVIVCLKC